MLSHGPLTRLTADISAQPAGAAAARFRPATRVHAGLGGRFAPFGDLVCCLRVEEGAAGGRSGCGCRRLPVLHLPRSAITET